MDEIKNVYIDKEYILDVVGKKFGKLLVKNYAYSNLKPNGKYKHYYNCECDCGNTHLVQRACFQGKVTTISCGCAYKTWRAERSIIELELKKTRDELPSQLKNLYSRFKSNVKYRNLECNLTLQDYKNLILSNCHYCGIEPSNTYKESRHLSILKYNGVDRINSNIGYLKGNVLASCWMCNRAKNSTGYLEFKEYLQRVANHVNKQ